MEAKEKAIELVAKLTLSSNAQDGSWMCEDLAKQCALIAANEVLGYMGADRGTEFWQQVKIENEKL